MCLKIVLTLWILFVTSSEARSIRGTCTPPQPPRCDRDVCNKLYYHSQKSEKCEQCLYCPSGEEPDHVDACAAQANGVEVKCRPCAAGTFSFAYDQARCKPCHIICDFFERETDVECSTTTDRECGKCKPGFISSYDEDQCWPCRASDRHKKECLMSTTPASSPTAIGETTTQMRTSKAAMTTSHEISTTKAVHSKPEIWTAISRQDPVFRTHVSSEISTSDLIFRLALVGGGIVVFAMITCCCVHYVYNDRVKYAGSTETSRSASVESDNRSTDTHEQNEETPSSPDNEETSLSSDTPSLSDARTSDQADPVIAANLNGPIVMKSFIKQFQTNPSREETQTCQVKSDVVPLKTSSMSPTSPPELLPKVAEGFCGRPKTVTRGRSLSLPFIGLTVNPLDRIQDKSIQRDLQRISDASSGDESDRGSTGVPEEAKYLLHKYNPKLSKGSTSLAVPTVRKSRSRRSSLTSIGPLCSAGGAFSSGSTKDEFALDSQAQSTTSMNNPSIQSQSQRNLQSLTSHPSKTPQRKRREITRQQSYDNPLTVHEQSPEDEPNETDSLLAKSQESPKGPVAQPEQDSVGVPALITYHPLIEQYGGRADAPGFANQYGSPSLSDPSTNRSPEPAPTIISDFSSMLTPSIPSSSSISQLRRLQNTSMPSIVQSSPAGTVTNIYHGPVIHAPNGTNIQLAVGDSNNRIQQGIPGRDTSESRSRPADVSHTQNCVECTDAAASFPTPEAEAKL
ncbi:uncharacterized protein [Amphiura filiformis]|uniref:uncharacterized protein isoform X2 n=1 Tax=Amphiura filiformis TaxID=82378 RepID=UPI003B21CFA7